jgi:hypothetical protein
LGQAFGFVAQEVEDIELARAEIPAAEEAAAGVPDGIGGGEQGEQSLVAAVGWGA